MNHSSCAEQNRNLYAFVVVRSRLWSCVVVRGCSLSCAVVYGRAWSFVVVRREVSGHDLGWIHTRARIHAHTHTHARAHARTCARTHTHTHTQINRQGLVSKLVVHTSIILYYHLDWSCLIQTVLCFTDSEETIIARRTSQAQFESIAISGILNLIVGSSTTAYMNILLSHASQTRFEILYTHVYRPYYSRI